MPKRFYTSPHPWSSTWHRSTVYWTCFFSKDTVKTLCQNTNKQAAKNFAKGKKYTCTDGTIEENCKFLGLVLFVALVPRRPISDFCQGTTFSPCPFLERWWPGTDSEKSLGTVTLSDSEEETNDRKKGTAEYDSWFRVKPLLDAVHAACQSFYHPNKNLSIDERMVASKAKTGMTQ